MRRAAGWCTVAMSLAIASVGCGTTAPPESAYARDLDQITTSPYGAYVWLTDGTRRTSDPQGELLGLRDGYVYVQSKKGIECFRSQLYPRIVLYRYQVENLAPWFGLGALVSVPIHGLMWLVLSGPLWGVGATTTAGTTQGESFGLGSEREGLRDWSRYPAGVPSVVARRAVGDCPGAADSFPETNDLEPPEPLRGAPPDNIVR